MDLNIEKTGKISQREFRFYLNFWGLELSQDEFDYIFNKFDLDGDGLISYKDFQISIGSEMFPAEGLYFRQDVPQQVKIVICQHEECFQPTKHSQNYCILHYKMHADQTEKIFTKIFKKIGKLWPKFLEELQKEAEPDDTSQISLKKFVVVLSKYGANLSENEKKSMATSFPGKEVAGKDDIISIAKVYDQKYKIMLDEMYEKVDNLKIENHADMPTDVSGYLG